MSMTPPNPQPEPHSPVETSGAEQVPAPVVDGPGSVEAALESATAAAETLKTAAAGGRYDLPDLEDGPPPPDSAGLSLLGDVKLRVKIELGRTTMYVEDVLRLNENSVVELDKAAGDPVDIFVNDRHIARGEVLVLDDNFCVRVSEIIEPLEDETTKPA